MRFFFSCKGLSFFCTELCFLSFPSVCFFLSKCLCLFFARFFFLAKGCDFSSQGVVLLLVARSCDVSYNVLFFLLGVVFCLKQRVAFFVDFFCDILCFLCKDLCLKFFQVFFCMFLFFNLFLHWVWNFLFAIFFFWRWVLLSFVHVFLEVFVSSLLKSGFFFSIFLQVVLVCKGFSFFIFRWFSCSHARDLLFYQGFFSKRVCFLQWVLFFFGKCFCQSVRFFRKRLCLFSAVFFRLVFLQGFLCWVFFFCNVVFFRSGSGPVSIGFSVV